MRSGRKSLVVSFAVRQCGGLGEKGLFPSFSVFLTLRPAGGFATEARSRPRFCGITLSIISPSLDNVSIMIFFSVSVSPIAWGQEPKGPR